LKHKLSSDGMYRIAIEWPEERAFAAFYVGLKNLEGI
jgi:hypothetical protein